MEVKHYASSAAVQEAEKAGEILFIVFKALCMDTSEVCVIPSALSRATGKQKSTLT